MKVLSTDSRNAEKKLSRWLGPGWFSHPVGFNAGRISDDKAKPIVEKLRPLGTVHEVVYKTPSLAGLRLFYVDRIPYRRLGVPKSECTYKTYPPSGATTPIQ